MLIKPKTKEEIRQVMKSGKAIEIFEGNKTRNLKAKQNLPNFTLINVEPLLDENRNVARLGAWEAIDRCIKMKKIPAGLKDADKYAEKNHGIYWTGVLIAYHDELKKVQEIIYFDREGNSKYILKIPDVMQPLQQNEALILPFNFFDDGTPYFQCIKTAFKGRPINEIVINRAGELIGSGSLATARLPTDNGYYLLDEDMFIPNGDEADFDSLNARFLEREIYMQYAGILKVKTQSGRMISATGSPSMKHKMLVYP
jgi:hypothetical protein